MITKYKNDSRTKICRPATDVISFEDGIKIFMDVPGADEEKVDVSVEDNVLSVRASCTECLEESFKALHAEFEPCDYFREFTLPRNISSAKISAKIKDGVLELTLPFSDEVKPKKIQITKE